MRKVLHVINGEHYAGAERVQDLLGRFLPAFGYQADFVTLMHGKFADVVKDREYTVHSMVMNGRLDLRPAIKIAQLVRKHGYQIVHAHTVRSALVGAVASLLAGVPFILHIHSPASRESSSSLKNMLHVWIEKLVRSRVDRFVCVSDSLAVRLNASGVKAERLAVVKNGIWMPDEVRAQAIRHDDRNRRFQIGMVALLRPRKGMEVLLEALRILKMNRDDFICRVIGPFEAQSYELEIKKYVEEFGLSGNVEFLGFRTDVYMLMANLDTLALPSLYGEGIPMVAIEAMALRVPVVSTEVEGLPELIPDPRFGLLCRPGDAEAFAKALAELMDSPERCEAIGTAAFLRQQESFSETSMSEGVAAIYDQLLPELSGVNK